MFFKIVGRMIYDVLKFIGGFILVMYLLFSLIGCFGMIWLTLPGYWFLIGVPFWGLCIAYVGSCIKEEYDEHKREMEE